MNLKHHLQIRLLKWANFNALEPYIPSLGALLRMPKDDKTAQASSRVYGFKKHFKNADDFRMILEAAAVHFACDGIVPVPPSSPDRQPNSLQRLFGTPIKRTREVETRKYNHNRFFPEHYRETYEVAPPEGRRFLLVDDILRTGGTMNHFRVTMAGMGLETVPLALGIYYRLPYTAGDSIVIFVQKTEIDLALDEMILEI
jgi:hypothetical protein